MAVETAEIVFFSIVAVMGLVWLWGTVLAFSRLRPGRRDGRDAGYAPEADAETAHAVTGETTIEGDAKAISKKIAEQLVASTSMAGGSALEITERTSEVVAFKRATGTGGQSVFDDGFFRLKPDGDKVRVQYAVSMKRFAKIMKLATYLVCFLWGGLWVIGVPVFLWLYVVHHTKVPVRWQTFQAFQMAHGVWPPFLVGFMAGKLRRTTASFFETLLANLRHIT